MDEEADEDGGWMVPHGYLSDDEGADADLEDVEDGAEADAVRQSRREQRLARAQALQEYVARPSPPVARVAFFM